MGIALLVGCGGGEPTPDAAVIDAAPPVPDAAVYDAAPADAPPALTTPELEPVSFDTTPDRFVDEPRHRGNRVALTDHRRADKPHHDMISRR